MKVLHQLALSAAMSAMLIFAAAEADAQGRVVNGGWSAPPPRHGGALSGGPRGHGFIGFPAFVVEREAPVIIEREIVREVPVAVATPPPPPPREPWVLGKTYAALPPDGCMKLIEDGASYYLCSGEWYRQVGSGYRAVRGP